MSIIPQQVAILFNEFQNLVDDYAMCPERYNEETLLRHNFEVHRALKKYPSAPRSKYMIAVMEVLSHPLREDLPIPWARIKELRTLRRVRLERPLYDSSGPSTKRMLQDVELAAPGSRRDETTHFLIPTAGSSQAVHESKTDTGCPSAREARTLGVTMSRSDLSEILQDKCENCIRSRRKECKKSRGRGTCDWCNSNRKRCSLTEAVKAHWKTAGYPGRRSRSRGVGARTTARQVQTEDRVGDAETPTPGQLAERIAALESTMVQLGNQMVQTDHDLSGLRLAVEERHKIQDMLQHQLQNYEVEHLSTKAAIKEAFDMARQVKKRDV